MVPPERRPLEDLSPRGKLIAACAAILVVFGILGVAMAVSGGGGSSSGGSGLTSSSTCTDFELASESDRLSYVEEHPSLSAAAGETGGTGTGYLEQICQAELAYEGSDPELGQIAGE